jgi:hypothetical protein
MRLFAHAVDRPDAAYPQLVESDVLFGGLANQSDTEGMVATWPMSREEGLARMEIGSASGR